MIMGRCVHATQLPYARGQPAERTYFDAGTLTLSVGDREWSIEPRGPVRDSEGRDHDVAYMDAKDTPDTPEYLAPGKEYTIRLSGSDAFPATTYEDALYLPEAYEEVEPGHPAVMVIPRGQDLEWSWVPAENADADGRIHYHWITFHDGNLATGGMGETCFTEDNGEFAVPKETIGKLPPAGIVAYGSATIRSVELVGGDISGRRLDLVGTYLYTAAFVVVDAPLEAEGLP
jgi:hypothetical protein